MAIRLPSERGVISLSKIELVGRLPEKALKGARKAISSSLFPGFFQLFGGCFFGFPVHQCFGLRKEIRQ